MKKLLLALCFLLTQATLAAVVPAGSIEIRAGDGSVRTIGPQDDGVKVEQRGDVQTWFVPAFGFEDGTTFSELVFSFDPDPFISFSFSLTKLSTTNSTYIVTFGAPYVGGPYDTASSLLEASVQSQASVDVTSISHSTLVDSLTVLTTSTGPCSSSGGTLTTCTPASGTTAMSPTASSGFFSSSFSMTVNGPSQVFFSGRSDIFMSNGVPVPASWALVLPALGAMGSLYGRRARGTTPVRRHRHVAT